MDFEDMKTLVVLCEEAGKEKFQQINAIRALMGLSLPKVAELLDQLILAGMIDKQ